MADVPATSVTPEVLRAALGGGTGVTLEQATDLLEGASTLVADAFLNAFRDVPEGMVNVCVIRTARGLRDSAKASTGAGQVGIDGAVPLRSPADPLTSSYPIIRRYVVMGI